MKTQRLLVTLTAVNAVLLVFLIAQMRPGKPMGDMLEASKFFRQSGVQSRPTQCHGIDLVTDKPHISAEHVSADALTGRYFAGRPDGLRPPRNAEELIVVTAQPRATP